MAEALVLMGAILILLWVWLSGLSLANLAVGIVIVGLAIIGVRTANNYNSRGLEEKKPERPLSKYCPTELANWRRGQRYRDKWAREAVFDKVKLIPVVIGAAFLLLIVMEIISTIYNGSASILGPHWPT